MTILNTKSILANSGSEGVARFHSIFCSSESVDSAHVAQKRGRWSQTYWGPQGFSPALLKWSKPQTELSYQKETVKRTRECGWIFRGESQWTPWYAGSLKSTLYRLICIVALPVTLWNAIANYVVFISWIWLPTRDIRRQKYAWVPLTMQRNNKIYRTVRMRN